MSAVTDASALTQAPLRRGRLFAVVWVYVGVVLGLLVLTCFSVYLLSAVRAYVGGEGLWSKAQKDALYALTRYTLHARPADYTAYRNALSVNEGDRLARTELAKPEPDFAVAEAGLRQGRNHPDDVVGMVLLVRWFQSLPELREAIGFWTQADEHVGELTRLGDDIHTAVQAGPLSPAQTAQFLQQLQTLNEAITPLADGFSYTLGVAARKYTQLVWVTMLVAVLMMLFLAYLVSRRLLLGFENSHDELQHRAYHDVLTQLPNRAMFVDAFQRSLHRLERSGGSGSLLFVDLDHFKAVNDALGHDMGDLLLQQVASRIQGCVREGDLLARLGGDEFVVLVEGHDDAYRMAEKILSVLRSDYRLGNQVVHVTASIGVSCFPQDGRELNDLLNAADSAMYGAKTAGRDGVQFYAHPE